MTIPVRVAHVVEHDSLTATDVQIAHDVRDRDSISARSSTGLPGGGKGRGQPSEPLHRLVERAEKRSSSDIAEGEPSRIAAEARHLRPVGVQGGTLHLEDVSDVEHVAEACRDPQSSTHGDGGAENGGCLPTSPHRWADVRATKRHRDLGPVVPAPDGVLEDGGAHAGFGERLHCDVVGGAMIRRALER